MRTRRKPVQEIRSLAEDIEAFLAHCRAKGLSPKTVERSYGWSLYKLLIPFAEARGITTTAGLSDALLGELAREVHSRTHLSVASRRTYLKGINQFMGWVDKDGPRSPLPKLPKIERDVLSSQEMRALAAASPYQRDQLIIQLMAQTGMREGEVASINVGDVTERDRSPVVHVRGKTGERYVPVSPELHKSLRKLAAGRPEGLTTKRLFLGLRRRPGRSLEALSANGIYQVVKQAAARLGLDRRIYPHLLRHSAISRMVAIGMHPAMVSDICGVSTAIIAKHYSHQGFRQKHEALMRSLEEG